MNLKKMAGTAAIAAGLGAAGLGLGAGSAQADRIWVPDVPGIPWAGHWVDEWIPEPNLGPPGQVKKWCPVDSPPGHWIGGPHGIPCT
ncbi:MAG: hypothetical protein QOK02_1880 [Mycobacterium sp.]|jgi:hypothetical protein|nr:hypothetical protein [Mycobacterium sp.]